MARLISDIFFLFSMSQVFFCFSIPPLMLYFVLNEYFLLQHFSFFNDFLKNLYFLEQFYVYNKIERKVWRFPVYPHPYTCITLPFINITTRIMYFSKDKPTLMHHDLTKSVVYLMDHSWCYTFYRFGQMYNDMYPSL